MKRGGDNNGGSAVTRGGRDVVIVVGSRPNVSHKDTVYYNTGTVRGGITASLAAAVSVAAAAVDVVEWRSMDGGEIMEKTSEFCVVIMFVVLVARRLWPQVINETRRLRGKRNDYDPGRPTGRVTGRVVTL